MRHNYLHCKFLLTKSQDAQELYCRQALQVDMVPPRRRQRFVSSETDDALTREQLYQQLLFAREDILSPGSRPGAVSAQADRAQDSNRGLY